jgi:hypothetical protein
MKQDLLAHLPGNEFILFAATNESSAIQTLAAKRLIPTRVRYMLWADVCDPAPGLRHMNTCHHVAGFTEHIARHIVQKYTQRNLLN